MMHNSRNIVVLESEANKLGDLFSRLIGDYFHTLGYDNLRFNIHKSGREIDIEATHRTEKRRVIAECKATQDKVGGDEINKFVGSLDAEKRKSSESETIGYFVSLSGFKETAIEQEKETGNKRVILVNAGQILDELIRGRIIVSQERAAERAGRCAMKKSKDLILDSMELIAHDMGWIWVAYYSRNKEITHFALIHADGEALSQSQAKKIIRTDAIISGNLNSLTYLEPQEELSSRSISLDEIKKKYLKYLADECGEIQLEGLPADQEVGARRLRLESIFVPLYLRPAFDQGLGKMPESDSKDDDENIGVDEKNRESVGSVLSKHSRLAILATPGGGKSTLLKRLAIAYAFPDRRKLISDNLPNREYLPLFIRCRQLADVSNASIEDIIITIAHRAEMSGHKPELMAIVQNSLRNGEALLLIDGLDEISDEGARLAFVNQLRTFMATYPTSSVVLTSREAGFRIVGGALIHLCRHYVIADLQRDDIKRLTVAWHREVIGDKHSVITEAEKLVESICETDRVLRLAKNPLLLTTLLLVKRWIGQLPTRRTVLYGKAIEVLLMTWNVEGHTPLDQDEVIPQLSFVAFTMMNEGIQRISLRRLREVIGLARAQMPEILGFAKLSVNEFVQRVEQRSSLMILSGYEVELGTLYPMYEFRHLTFQEYLTAKAIVDGYYPDRTNADTLLSVVEQRLGDHSWKEVIPLAAVLSGRNAQPLIEHLIKALKNVSREERKKYKKNYPVQLLGQCILDEVQITPSLLKTALEGLARCNYSEQSSIILSLYKGKYGELLLNIIKENFATASEDLLRLGSALAIITLAQIDFVELKDLNKEVANKLHNLLKSDEAIQRAAGAAALMEIAFMFNVRTDLKKSLKKRHESGERGGYLTESRKQIFFELTDQLLPLLYSDNEQHQFIACWALAWIGNLGVWAPKYKPDVINRLLYVWRSANISETKYVSAWAISSLPLMDRNKFLIRDNFAVDDFLREQYSQPANDFHGEARVRASLTIGFYYRKPWSDQELVQHIQSKGSKSRLAKHHIDGMMKVLMSSSNEPQT